MHAEASRTQRDRLPQLIADLLARGDDRTEQRTNAHNAETAADRARNQAWTRMAERQRHHDAEQAINRERGNDGDYLGM